MNDIDLIKRISEVVGCHHDDGLIVAYGNWINPLIDTMRAKAFCFDLMEQYDLAPEICDDDSGDWRVWFNDYTYTVIADGLQRAILLAVVTKSETK